jgi:dUTP pyrophosphatase
MNLTNMPREFTPPGSYRPLVDLPVSPVIDWYRTHPDAKLPTLAHSDPDTGDTGYDVYAVEDVTIPSMDGERLKDLAELSQPRDYRIPSRVVPIGLEVAYITPGYWFQVAAKSGLGFKHELRPHPGIIDNGYRGDCGIKIYNFGSQPYTFHKGDKVAQLVIHKLYHVNMNWADEKSSSRRGAKGYGSTGK